MIWCVRLIKILSFMGVLVSAPIFFILKDPTPIVFESLESKTVTENSVFNEVTFKGGLKQDVWIMNQSHGGTSLEKNKWDKIAIVVDHLSKKAIFAQIDPESEWPFEKRDLVPLKASCFMCHSNGPRAIRPFLESKEVKVSFWNRMRLHMWNVRIKTYGALSGEVNVATPNIGKTFRMEHPMTNERLTVKSCTKCHSNSGLFARNFLTKQNAFTIKFMLENNFMPPMGFSLSADDRERVEDFLKMTNIK